METRGPFVGCKMETRGPFGPDIAHMGILSQFGQNPFSCYLDIVLFYVLCCFTTADGDHLAIPNCKKEAVTIPLRDFSSFYTLLFFVNRCHLDRSIFI